MLATQNDVLTCKSTLEIGTFVPLQQCPHGLPAPRGCISSLYACQDCTHVVEGGNKPFTQSCVSPGSECRLLVLARWDQRARIHT